MVILLTDVQPTPHRERGLGFLVAHQRPSFQFGRSPIERQSPAPTLRRDLPNTAALSLSAVSQRHHARRPQPHHGAHQKGNGYLRRWFGRGFWLTTLAGFGLSLALELTQLTGIWGIYAVRYRSFDVDDLVASTLGASLGWLLAPLVVLLPARRHTDNQPAAVGSLSPGRRFLALLVDSTSIRRRSFVGDGFGILGGGVTAVRGEGVECPPVCPAFPLQVPGRARWAVGQLVARMGGPRAAVYRVSSSSCQGQRRGRWSRHRRAWFAILPATWIRVRRTVAVRALPRVADARRAAARVRLNVSCVRDRVAFRGLNQTTLWGSG